MTTLDDSRKVRALTAADFPELPLTTGRLDTHGIVDQRDTKALREISHRLARMTPRKRPPSVPVERHAVEDDPDLQHRLNAARSADRIDRELEALEARIDRTGRVVSRRFDDIVDVLTEWGYVDDWKLTERGQVLTRVFHESDLLVSECLVEGVFDDIDASSLAAVASMFVYEHRGADPAPPARFPSATLKSRWQATERISRRMSIDESRVGVPVHRTPDPHIVELMWSWAEGGELADVLPDDVVAGDFVRLTKQTVDLVRQVATVAPRADTRATAQDAHRRLARGIIAVSSSLEPA